MLKEGNRALIVFNCPPYVSSAFNKDDMSPREGNILDLEEDENMAAPRRTGE